MCSHTESQSEPEAVEHLARVASGLSSMQHLGARIGPMCAISDARKAMLWRIY